MKARWLGAFVVAGICTAGCGDDDDNDPVDASTIDAPTVDGGTDGSTTGDGGEDASAHEALVERGGYLVNNVGVCSFCHTPLREDFTRDLDRFLSGWDCVFDTDKPAAEPSDDFGCIPSPNLTNHETGLMNVSDEAIKFAIRYGIGTDGRVLHPLMPYTVFHNLTEYDLDAIIAYLRTVPGIDHRPPPTQEPWETIERPPAPANYAKMEDVPMPDEEYPEYESALRGRYLASSAATCMACHTPRGAVPKGLVFPHPDYIDMTKPFAGNRPIPRRILGFYDSPYPFFVFTSNITPDVKTGIGNWTFEDIVHLLREGQDIEDRYVCAAAHGSPNGWIAGMTDQDIEDIAHYLKSMPPIENNVAIQCTVDIEPE